MEIAHNGLPDIHDSDRYVCLRGVAILDEGPSDRFDFAVEDLQRFIEATNKRIEGGDYILLMLGHTDDESPEWEQPEPLGYAVDLRLGQLPSGRAAILADYYLQVDRYEEAMTYPRRSVELFEDSGVIDIVSFLRRAPERSMGLLTCKKLHERSIYQYSHTGDKMTPEDIDLLASKLAALLQMEKDDDEDKKDDLEADSEEEVKDEDKKDDLEADSEEGKDDDEGDKKDDLEASCPSGTDTFVPGEIDEDKARKMRRDSDRIKLSRLERELGEVKDENAVLRLKLNRAEREGDLKQLQAEGYQFDPVEELAHVEVMDEKDYDRYLTRARKLFRRLPIGGGMIPTAPAQPKGGMGKDDIDKVVKLSAEKKITYAEALRQYKEAN